MAEGVHAFVFTCPSYGHAVPALELSYLLIANGLSVTYVSSEYFILRFSREHEHHPQLRMVGLPDGLPADYPESPFDQRFFQSCYALQDPAEKVVEEAILSQHSTTTHIIIADLFVAIWTSKVAKKFHLQWIPVWLSSFSSFDLMIVKLPMLIQRGYIRSKDGKPMALTQIVDGLSDLPEIRVMDLPDVLTDPNVPLWFLDFLVDTGNTFKDSQVLLGSSFEELESGIIQSLSRNNEIVVYPVGPLLPQSCFSKQDHISSSCGEEEKKCMEWLETQRAGSVLYVAFGSLAVLPTDQLRILAEGIYASGQPFLWVIRDKANPFLPSEHHNGLIISWAPQVQVLKHPFVGGFLTHCGWNSTMEAVCAAVPLIVWPLMSEQSTNAKFIVEEWKVGIRLQLTPQSDGRKTLIRGNSTVSECITQLFHKDQGSNLRLAMADFSSRVKIAVNRGGSSHSNLISFIRSLRIN